MREYALNHEERKSNEESSVTTQKILKIGEKELLVLQNHEKPPNLPYVFVAGYIASDPYKNNYGINVVECESVPEEEKQELEGILRKEGFEGHINFG